MYLNGTEIAPLPEQHQGAVVQDGTLYLPLRNVFEAMGAIVEYDNTYEEISGGLGGMDYYTTVGAYKVIINGSVYVLEAPVITINNRALVVPQAIVDCSEPQSTGTREKIELISHIPRIAKRFSR